MRKSSTPKAAVSKAEAQAQVRALIAPRIPEIIEAHIAAATGLVHFHVRNAEGQWERETNLDKIIAIRSDPTKEEGTHYYASLKDPDVRSATILLAYALDKPAEQEQSVNVNGTIKLTWDE